MAKKSVARRPATAAPATKKPSVVSKCRNALVSIRTANHAASLHDHIMRYIQPTERHEYTNAVAQMKNLLKDPHNATLIGTLIFPSETTRQTVAKWAGSASPMADTFPMPDWTYTKSVVDLTVAIENLSNAPVSYEERKIISRMSARTFGVFAAKMGLASTNVSEIKSMLTELTTEVKMLRSQSFTPVAIETSVETAAA